MSVEAKQPIIELTEHQYLVLYLAENDRRGTVDLVRAYCDRHGITRIGHMREFIALVRADADAGGENQ